ncbi:MAG: redox-sensing transcriptional repressor Rex [Chloroflexi bacterium]|nr:redox-sensing transcriptional repressor Rex [Chloroflexota bacterium]MBI5956163.1 redox-sensing transcriptional repressor Rex [Chloroflexota bacterium]
MNTPEIPEIVVRRLPLYARTLSWLVEENVQTVSSQELGANLGMSPAQIRKDLSYFGEFGKQGTGYDVKYLLSQLRQILGVEREWLVALVGVGDLGHAIARYGGFGKRGFKIAALFDNDPRKIGQQVGELEILGMEALPMVVKGLRLRLGIVAVPAAKAQEVTDYLVECGIRGILNYAPINLHVPKGVRVRYIDPVVLLQSMTYHLKSG